MLRAGSQKSRFVVACCSSDQCSGFRGGYSEQLVTGREGLQDECSKRERLEEVEGMKRADVGMVDEVEMETDCPGSGVTIQSTCAVYY
jgi:hypothetical protein